MGEVFSVFILKSQAGTMSQAENFLRNRGWIVGSGTNIREALAYIIQKHPQYVFLSADHANKKVRVLPKMLVQAFPVRVIGFSEKNTGLSSRHLGEMGLEYNLYPPVSGPSIERMVLKIRKDDELKAHQANNPKTPRTQDGGSQDNITFKGETDSGESLKASFEQARAALSQLVSSGDSEESSEGSLTQTGSSATQGGSITQEGSGHKGGPAYWGNAGAKADEMGAKSGSVSAAESSAQQAGESFDEWAERMRKSAEKQQSQQQSGASNEARSATQGSGSGTDGNTSDWQGSGSTAGSAITPNPNSQADADRRNRGLKAPIMESESLGKKDSKEMRIRNSRQEDLSKQSIIVRGAQQAMNETLNLKGEDQVQAVEKASNIACITVQSPKFNGYLVCAMGRDRKMDKTLIDTIQKRLFGFLKANGETINEKDTMEMKIQEVDFTDWALEQAQFLRRSVHDGDEIAMAFFPTNDLEVALEDSASGRMLQMSLDDLKENVALEFDLYIYMPENNKYLLYTPQGKPFYGKQKGRLQEKGVTHMHLRKDASHNVKKYRAQNFLNEKIESYRQAVKLKSAGP